MNNFKENMVTFLKRYNQNVFNSKSNYKIPISEFYITYTILTLENNSLTNSVRSVDNTIESTQLTEAVVLIRTRNDLDLGHKLFSDLQHIVTKEILRELDIFYVNARNFVEIQNNNQTRLNVLGHSMYLDCQFYDLNVIEVETVEHISKRNEKWQLINQQ